MRAWIPGDGGQGGTYSGRLRCHGRLRVAGLGVPLALEALGRNTSEPYEMILVDNGGAEVASVPDYARVELVRNQENVGFGPASNKGVELAQADVVCFLNPDALVEPAWLPPLLERLDEADVGAVVPAKLNADGTMQQAGALRLWR